MFKRIFNKNAAKGNNTSPIETRPKGGSKQEELKELVKQYNSVLIGLFKMCRNLIQEKNNIKLKLIARFLNKFRSSDIIPRISGKYLKKYSNEILNEDIEFFSNFDNIEELKHYRSVSKIGIKIIDKIKDAYMRSTEDIKDKIYSDVLDLLEIYIKIEDLEYEIFGEKYVNEDINTKMPEYLEADEFLDEELADEGN